MKKLLRTGFYILLFLSGFFVGILCQKRIWTVVDPTKTIGAWELIGIIVAMIGSFGTCAAVVVAIAKERIVRFFNHPTISARLQDTDTGFYEEIDSEQSTPVSSEYYCIAEILNSGKVTANECEIKIDKILYSDRKGKMKPIRNETGTISCKVPWDMEEKINLPSGLRKEVVLFKISQPNRTVMPDTGDSAINNGPKLSICGFPLKENKSQKGIWEVHYYVSYDAGEHTHFVLTIDWSGEWRNRLSEMRDELHLKLCKDENISNNKQ